MELMASPSSFQQLEELKNYTLYLWLTDVDGANSSAIQSLPVPVPDETPPIVDPIPYSVAQGTTGNTIAMRSDMNEKGTIYWAEQGVVQLAALGGHHGDLSHISGDPRHIGVALSEGGDSVVRSAEGDYLHRAALVLVPSIGRSAPSRTVPSARTT